MITSKKQWEELSNIGYKRKYEYPVMNPFLCGVSRSLNVRINNPLSKINPYTEK